RRNGISDSRTVPSSDGADQVRRFSVVKKQGAACGKGKGDRCASAPAHDCVLRRERRNWSTLSSAGRNRYAIWYYGRFRNARRKRSGVVRYCDLTGSRLDETGACFDQRFAAHLVVTDCLIL